MRAFAIEFVLWLRGILGRPPPQVNAPRGQYVKQ